MAAPIALISPKHIFGLNPQICDNLHYINEQNLIFISGTLGVIYDIDHHSQRYIFSVGEGSQAHLMLLSPNKQLMAVGERCDNPNKLQLGIGVYDVTNTMKKVATLTALKLQRQLQQQHLNDVDRKGRIRFVSMAFSHDGKFVVGQAGPPEWTFIYWDVESGKPMVTLSMVKDLSLAPIYQVSFHPHDNDQISVVGCCEYSLLQLVEGSTVKVISSHRSQAQMTTYRCHSWVSDNRILVGCDRGTVILIEGSEVLQKFQIKIPPENEGNTDLDRFDPENDLAAGLQSETRAVVKLVTFSKGFICSCGGDAVYLFERYAGGKIYRQAAIVKLPADEDKGPKQTVIKNEISTLTLSPSEDIIAVVTAQRNVYTFTLSTVDINKQLSCHFEQLTPKVHCAPVVDVDICLQKPIAVTCSTDGVVAVWNYVTNQQQLYQYLDEEVYSIALHPTGHYIAVGCKTNLRLMGLMIDEMRTVHEFSIKECPSVVFSNSGHLIGAVQGSVIMVFSNITFDSIATFKGHVGKITAIDWSFDDLRLISCGVDGAVYEWDVHTHKRSNEVVIQQCSWKSIATSRDNFTTFVAGSDGIIREIAESQVLGEVNLNMNLPLTSVVAFDCGKAIIVSSSKGHIWLISIPYTNQDDHWHEISPVGSDVTKLKVTKDDRWLLSVSSDGSFCVWTITDKNGQLFRPEDELPFLEEILITRADLEEKNLTICELDQQLRDMKFELVQERKLREEAHRKFISDLNKTYEDKIKRLQNEIQVANGRLDGLKSSHEKTVMAMNEQINQTLKRIQQENDQKLLLEYLKTDELQLGNEKLSLEFEQQMKQLQDDKSNDVHNLKMQFKEQLDKTTLELGNIKKSLQEMKDRCEEDIGMMKEEAERLIDSLKTSFEMQIIEEKKNLMKHKSEIGVNRRKLQSLERNIDEQKKINEMELRDKRQLQMAIEKLQQELSFFKKEIKSRDGLLKVKELELYEARRWTKNLKQLTTLLEAKSTELNNQMSSKQVELEGIKEELKSKVIEQQSVQKAVIDLELSNQYLKNQLVAKSKISETHRNKVINLENKWTALSQDVVNCVKQSDKFTNLKNNLIMICRKYNL